MDLLSGEERELGEVVVEKGRDEGTLCVCGIDKEGGDEQGEPMKGEGGEPRGKSSRNRLAVRRSSGHVGA